MEIRSNVRSISPHARSTIERLLTNGQISGNGEFGLKCESWLETRLSCHKALITVSCTAALEMSAILLELGRGDEVIMPSFTFSSTANAVVLRDATPVFVDIDPTTMNLDLRKVEALISPATKAIFVVHYAGRVPDMQALREIADRHDIPIVEDAAQSLGSTHKGKPAGTHGDLATISFHETKNVISGEGGALIINNPRYVDRAQILREKGTNRHTFVAGKTEKYSWVDIGSSFVLSEVLAALLYENLDLTDSITQRRQQIWHKYHQALTAMAGDGIILPKLDDENCMHNAHLFYVVLPQIEHVKKLVTRCSHKNIQLNTHYVPLHNSIAGKRYGKTPIPCTATEFCAPRLVRLPLHAELTDSAVEMVIGQVGDFLDELS